MGLFLVRGAGGSLFIENIGGDLEKHSAVLGYLRGKAAVKGSQVFVLRQVMVASTAVWKKNSSGEGVCRGDYNPAKNCGSGVQPYFLFHRSQQIRPVK
jgi:hypothetical protein